jgi:hypothetical protein
MLTSGSTGSLPFSTSTGTSSIDPEFLVSTAVFYPPSLPGKNRVEVPNRAGQDEDDLLDLWKSVTDPGYHRPLLEQAEDGETVIRAQIAIHGAGRRARTCWQPRDRLPRGHPLGHVGGGCLGAGRVRGRPLFRRPRRH